MGAACPMQLWGPQGWLNCFASGSLCDHTKPWCVNAGLYRFRVPNVTHDYLLIEIVGCNVQGFLGFRDITLMTENHMEE